MTKPQVTRAEFEKTLFAYVHYVGSDAGMGLREELWAMVKRGAASALSEAERCILEIILSEGYGGFDGRQFELRSLIIEVRHLRAASKQAEREGA